MSALFLYFALATIGMFIWTYVVWDSLLASFRRRYPDEARAVFRDISVWIPSPVGDPVGRYFLSPLSQKFLEAKGDSELLGKRKMAVFLAGISVIAPLLGFTIIFIILAIL